MLYSYNFESYSFNYEYLVKSAECEIQLQQCFVKKYKELKYNFEYSIFITSSHFWSNVLQLKARLSAAEFHPEKSKINPQFALSFNFDLFHQGLKT